MTAVGTLTRRMSAAGVVAGCLAALLAGCTSGDAKAVASPSPVVSKEPTPSPSPTVSEAEARKQANVEAAEKLVVDYNHDLDEAYHNHLKDWGDLVDYWGGDLRVQKIKDYTQDAQKGVYATGERVVAAQKVKDYAGDEGRETVRLSVCMDYTALTGFDADGTKVDVSGSPRRYVTEFLVGHQGGQSWTIDEIKPLPDEAC